MVETKDEGRRTKDRRERILRPSSFVLAALAAICCGAVAAASLRHTGSLAFPIDDGYIYSNYVLAAAQGDFFTYNTGEKSGGITSLGWFVLSTVAYWLLAPFHSSLGVLAPLAVRDNSELAAQAGHLYLAAYLPGVICLAATAVGVRRLASLVLPPADTNRLAREAFCWLLGAVAAADLGLVWGAMSGLEVALSSAVAVWAMGTLIADARAGRLRGCLLMAALMPWARPELSVLVFVGGLWLVMWDAIVCGRTIAGLRLASLYLLAILGGLASMMAIYQLGWGRPLPSSFYAKVGGLRVGSDFFSATEELLIAQRFLPFVVGALVLLGGLLPLLAIRRAREGTYRAQAVPGMLLLGACVAYVAAVMASVPWFGQEDRYLLPIHPLVIFLVGAIGWGALRSARFRLTESSRRFGGAAAVAVIALLVLVNYVWATRNYAVQVRNIEDGHVEPARWLAANTSPDAVVASEPIGAVKLFSQRRTLDLVGLTTQATLGTYGDWPRALPALREAGARYLLFYPQWFDGGFSPAWAVELERFTVPDNKIVGDDVIAVYEIAWERFGGRWRWPDRDFLAVSISP